MFITPYIMYALTRVISDLFSNLLYYCTGHDIIAYTPYEEQDIFKWKSLEIKCRCSALPFFTRLVNCG